MSRRRSPKKRSELDVSRARLAAERGTVFKDAPRRVALCYPNTFSVASSSLGFQVVYRLINERHGWACERAFYPDRPDRRPHGPLLSFERERPLGGFDIIAFSIAFELDVPHVAEMLAWAGVPPLAEDRGPEHPLVLLGGPITQSNCLPLGPFADVLLNGDAETRLDLFFDDFEASSSKPELLERTAEREGFWVPSIHEDRTPDIYRAPVDVLPAVGQTISPDAELKDMFLVEASRGCPRMCRFCVVRATVSPMRPSDPERITAAIPDWAPRVGFVGAAVSDYVHIKDVVRLAVERGKGVGISSLRADRLDEEFVDLLRRGGYRTLTVAGDAPSERQRNKMMKGIREKHLLRAAHLARWAKLRLLKMYMVIGLPGESEEDIEELIRFSRDLAGIGPMALTLSPFVPKLHTPMCADPFAGVKLVEAKLKRVRTALAGTVDVRSASAKWAWVEFKLSQGSFESGIQAWEAHQAGGSYGHYRKIFGTDDDHRPALDAAKQHGVWVPTGVDKTKPKPPKPPPKLPWHGVEARPLPASPSVGSSSAP